MSSTQPPLASSSPSVDITYLAGQSRTPLSNNPTRMLLTAAHSRVTLLLLPAMALPNHASADVKYATGFKLCDKPSFRGNCTFHSITSPTFSSCIPLDMGNGAMAVSVQWFEGVRCWASSAPGCFCLRGMGDCLTGVGPRIVEDTTKLQVKVYKDDKAQLARGWRCEPMVSMDTAGSGDM